MVIELPQPLLGAPQDAPQAIFTGSQPKLRATSASRHLFGRTSRKWRHTVLLAHQIETPFAADDMREELALDWPRIRSLIPRKQLLAWQAGAVASCEDRPSNLGLESIVLNRDVIGKENRWRRFTGRMTLLPIPCEVLEIVTSSSSPQVLSGAR